VYKGDDELKLHLEDVHGKGRADDLVG